MKKSFATRDAQSSIAQRANTLTTGERFVHDPYGDVYIPNFSWSSTGDAHSWIYGFQGGRTDVVSGLVHFGARDYSPTDGRWVEPDPAGYVDGINRFQAFEDAPPNGVDSTGLADKPSYPATQPDRPNWSDLGNLDLILIAYAKNDSQKNVANIVNGIHDYANKTSIPCYDITSVKEIVDDIVATSKAKAKASGAKAPTVPIRVIILGHGSDDSGIGIGSDDNFAPAIPNWSQASDKLQENDPGAVNAARAALQNDPLLSGIQGYVRELTFTGCSTAGSKRSKALYSIIAADLGAKITAFTYGTDTYATAANGIIVTPHKPTTDEPVTEAPPKDYGTFVYETGGNRAKK